MSNIIPFMLNNWNSVPVVEYKGEKGTSYWRTIEIDGIRMRIVEYSAKFLADHWCEKGHVLYCMEGCITIKLKNGGEYEIKKDMSFIVSDNSDAHFVSSENGAKVFILDGDFLKSK